MIKINDLEDIVISASDIIKKYFYEDVKVNYKSDETPVTIADEETNNYLRYNLLKLIPNVGWLSEEDKDNNERLNKEFVWIVDPLDGTQGFINKEPELSVSVALVRNGIPVVSAVYNPITQQGGFWNSFSDEIKFIGFKNKSENMELKNSSILVSNSEFKHKKVDEFIKVFPKIQPVGSVANKLMKIAGGESDFYYSVHAKSEWHIAGGIGLLMATNKKFVRFDKKEVIFNQLNSVINSGSVAGNDSLVREFFDNYLYLAKTATRK